MKVAGRRFGQLINIRDSRGWMVPREGTTRRAIYDGLVLGLSIGELAEGLGITRDAAWQHKDCITNWGQVHEYRRAGEMRELEECEG